MKRSAIIIAILLSIVLVNAQEECKDIIYPTDGKSIIFNCCIDEVKDGNIVYFVKEGKGYIVEAIAVNKDGRYIELTPGEGQQQPVEVVPQVETPTGLYKGHDYKYYNIQFIKATTQKHVGVILTLVGTGMTIGGLAMLVNEANKYYYNENNVIVGAMLYINGIIMVNIGIPLWIAGGIKRSNNRKAMEATKRNANLSLGITGNGAGLVLRF